MIYFPDRIMSRSPHDIGLEFESVEIETTDGVLIHGWYVPYENSRGTILFCHGNGSNISGRLETIQIFHRLKFTTFIFDYRGYGKSQGKPSEKGTYIDAESAYDYLVQEKSIDPNSIIMFGRSLGGAVAANLATKKSHRVLILESTFTSIMDIAKNLYPIFPVKLINRIHYDTINCVRQLDTPLLLIHSTEDDRIPFSHSEKLYDAASQTKEFIKISGDHNEGFLISGAVYIDGINDFLKINGF